MLHHVQANKMPLGRLPGSARLLEQAREGRSHLMAALTAAHLARASRSIRPEYPIACVQMGGLSLPRRYLARRIQACARTSHEAIFRKMPFQCVVVPEED